MAWYKTGTVSTTTGSTAVIAIDTKFVSNARVGDGFRGPDGDWYEVINIASETVIGIYPAYQGVSTSNSADYMIAPLQGYNKDSADKLRAITDSIRDFSEDVVAAHESAVAAKASEDAAKTSETNSKTSETNSKTSETNSAGSASSALTYKNQAEVARDEAVAAAGSVTGNLSDMGPWDASTGVYPARPATSAFWKVTGNGSATDKGETIEYGIGDTLMYTKSPLDNFYKIDNTESVSSVAGKTGVVVLVKGDVGLQNVDNTSDINKPLSTEAIAANNAQDAIIATKEPVIAAGSANQVWLGNKTWTDIAAAVRAISLAGLNTTLNTVITSADTVIDAFGKLQAQITQRAMKGVNSDITQITGLTTPLSTSQGGTGKTTALVEAGQGYIDGLNLIWNSATSISVTAGSAYIQGLNRTVTSSSALTLSGLSLSATTWYHVYLFDNSGTPSIEIVTTAPSVAFSGKARSKTGDTSRRYLGSVLTKAGGSIIKAKYYQTGKVQYHENVDGSPFSVLPAISTGTPVTVSVSNVAPVTAYMIEGGFISTSTGTNMYICNSDAGALSTNNFLQVYASPIAFYLTVALDSSQAFTIGFGSTPNGTTVYRVGSYFYER